MYRHALICRLLGVRPKDYDIVLSVFPDRSIFIDPKTTLENISLWKQLTDNGWSTNDIILLVGKTESTRIPLSDHALQFTSSIMEKINAIRGTWEPRIQNNMVKSRDVMDLCGHYMRRIKSVSLSVPCVVGPYTGLNATLCLLQHRYRVSSVAASGEDYAEDDMASGHFRTDIVPITSVAISSGIQDSGVFELNFEDDNFRPFEGAGAIGSWSLELPTVVRSFDYSTISDVILHVRYTFLDGGPLLRNAANQAVKTFRSRVEGLSSDGPGPFAMFDLKNDFSNAWYAFRSGLASKSVAELDLSGIKDRFPYWALGKTIIITGLSLVVFGKVTKNKLVQESFSIIALGKEKPWDPVPLGNATMLALSPLNTKLNDLDLEWKLKVSNERGDFTALENVVLVLRYALA
ncbi:hypothetical protein Forpe1208_v014077 [Fusarium oxysporum f. sp. rapae]|nr:hypothetical protein Forpe1208_v014077 [Fusarium oxysporum f. sp. rapae]